MASVDYGTDLSWADDLDLLGRSVTGTELLGQAVYRRLRTPRGSCLDAPDDGLDVAEFLSAALTEARIAAIPALVQQEILKDERIADVTVNMSRFSDGFNLTIWCTPAGGPSFELTIDVTAAAVKLLSINEAP